MKRFKILRRTCLIGLIALLLLSLHFYVPTDRGLWWRIFLETLHFSVFGLVKRKKRRRYKAQGTTLIGADSPNGLWCADYKGEFMLGNREYCYPLTISDYRSRYLLACEGVASTRRYHPNS